MALMMTKFHGLVRMLVIYHSQLLAVKNSTISTVVESYCDIELIVGRRNLG